MIDFKSSLVSVVLCQLPLFMSLSVEKKAFFLSEHKCNLMNNDMTGAAILLTAAHLVVFGKPIEVLEGSAFGSFSMKVIPYCTVKGDTSETKILIRNLGKTKCGSTNVESNGKYKYLFFLRNTSDPTVFYALNAGAKVITTPMLWNPQFVNYCDVKEKLDCKTSTAECNQKCNFRVRDRRSCDSNGRDVSYIFDREYPDGAPPALLTTPPKALGYSETSTSRQLTTVKGILPHQYSTSKAHVKSTVVPTVPRQLSTTEGVTSSSKPSTTKTVIPPQGRTTSKPIQLPKKSTLPPSSLNTVLVTPTTTTDRVTTSYKLSTSKVPPSSSSPGKRPAKDKVKEPELNRVSEKTGRPINKAFQNDENKTAMYLPDPKKSVEVKIAKENSSAVTRLGVDALFGALIFHVMLRV